MARAALVFGAVASVLLACAAWMLIDLARAGPNVPAREPMSLVALTPRTVIEQTFVMPACPLEEFSVRLARPPSQPDGRVVASFYMQTSDGDWSAAPTASASIEATRLAGDRLAWTIAAPAQGWRRPFKVRIERLDATRGELSLAATRAADYRFGALTLDGLAATSDLVFDAGPRGARGWGSLACLSHESPSALRSPAVIVAALAAFCLAAAAIAALPWAPSPSRVGASALVLLLYASGACAWLVVTPMFEGPDEPLHYDYVRWIAVHGGPPRAAPANTNEYETRDWYNDEWVQPPTYYALTSPILHALDVHSAPPLWDRAPRSTWFGGPEGVLYAHPDSPPNELITGVAALRAANVLINGAAIGVLWMALARALASPRGAALACAGLVLVPQFSSLSVVVSNDPLATLLSALASAAVLRGAALGFSTTRSVVAGALSGIAIATKITTGYLAPAGAIAVFMAPWSTRRAQVRALLMFVAGTMATAGWFFVRNWTLFGDPLARDFNQAILAPFIFPRPRTLLDPWLYTFLPNSIFETFWADFGWTTIRVPAGSWLWILYGGATFVLVACCGVAMLSAWRGSAQPIKTGAIDSSAQTAASRRLVAAVTIAIAVDIVLWVYANVTWGATQARHFYPLLLPLLLLCALGAKACLAIAEQRVGPAVVRVATGACVVALAIGWLWALRIAVLGFHFTF